MVRELKSKEDVLAHLASLGSEKRPLSVIPTFSSIDFGLLGLQLELPSGDTEILLYPLAGIGAEFRKVLARDRMDVITFVDDHPEALLYQNMQSQCVVLSDIQDKVALEAPARIVGNSRTLQHLSAKLLDNNDRITKSVLQDVAQQIYGIEARPISKKDSVVELTELKFSEDATELLIADRTDFMKFFDDIFGDQGAKLTKVRYDDGMYSQDMCLVSADAQIYAYIPATLTMQFMSVYNVLSEKQPYNEVTFYVKAK